MESANDFDQVASPGTMAGSTWWVVGIEVHVGCKEGVYVGTE